jgi:hypothetical protein
MTKTRQNATRSTRNRTRRPIKVLPISKRAPKTGLSRVAQTVIAGGTVLAAGAGATAAVLMRREVAKFAAKIAAEAVSAGHSAGAFGGSLGKSLRREATAIDLTRLLTYAGLSKRPSLLSRLWPSVGLAAFVAAASAAIVLIAPRLRSAGDETNRKNRTSEPLSAEPRSVGDSSSTHNSTGQVDGASYPT